MTRKQWMKQHHPENISSSFSGEVYGCPHEYPDLIEVDPNSAHRVEGCIWNCLDCWNAEIPEEFTGDKEDVMNEENVSVQTTGHMTREQFEKLLDELDGQSLETLKAKNAKYSSDDDVLHNFNAGAEIMGTTPAQCAWGYVTKHLVALRDKIQRDDFSDREDLLEKCQDIINYIRFIWCLANQGR